MTPCLALETFDFLPILFGQGFFWQAVFGRPIEERALDISHRVVPLVGAMRSQASREVGGELSEHLFGRCPEADSQGFDVGGFFSGELDEDFHDLYIVGIADKRQALFSALPIFILLLR